MKIDTSHFLEIVEN